MLIIFIVINLKSPNEKVTENMAKHLFFQPVSSVNCMHSYFSSNDWLPLKNAQALSNKSIQMKSPYGYDIAEKSLWGKSAD